MFCNAFTVSYSLCGFYEIMRIHLFYFPEVDPAGKSDMRELIKSGGFRADGTIEGICYNDLCSFQPFFYGLLTPNSLIPFPEKPFCDLQGTEELNFFFIFILYGSCQGTHGDWLTDYCDVELS